MGLYALQASRILRNASKAGDPSALPTLQQMSLLVGLLLGSVEQLRDYLRHLLSRRRSSPIPPVVNRTATVLLLALLLAWSVILTDSVLHYVTQTIDLSLITTEPAGASYGRALSSTCLNFNRTELFGWPCSVGIGWNDTNIFEEQIEHFQLAQNTSISSEIRLTSLQSDQKEEMAYLLPSSSSIDPNIEYHAATIGVSTTCELVPPTACNFTSWGPDLIYTNFTCSPSFYGTIGKTPNISEADGTRAPDPYRSPLMYKVAANLMFSFFSDSNMSSIYNTPGWGDDGQLSQSLLPLADSELINPFHVAFAARSSVSQIQPSSTLLKSSLTYTSPSGNAFLDYILHCTVTSHEVTYTSLLSFPSSSSTMSPNTPTAARAPSLHILTHTPSPNGTLLEIFHGAQLYTGIGQYGYDLQQYLISASISAQTPDDFTSAFANSYSTKVLAKIGAYTTPRTVLAQQSRRSLLVAKIPVASLASLVGVVMLYPVLGLVLGWMAVRGLRRGEDVRGIARQLSLAGMAGVAFGGAEEEVRGRGWSGNRGGMLMGAEGQGGGMSRKKEPEARRVVRVSGAPASGFVFKVLV